ncbi:MAG: stage IV sporulation protein A, partial [Clostridia bacterium]|nr:stage IV sporulation protein A [Clostridia bacterium]
MTDTSIYRDIMNRTDGDIYIGVVGPVRTGKSTFIKRFMESLVLPNIDNQFVRERAVDEMPQSAGGKTVMTTEPKFIPEEAINITLSDNVELNVKMVDCVGYVVPDAIGHTEEGKERMVNTPWSSEPLPFTKAAEIGTRKVITEHSTIGMVITTDGTITDISRENYIEAEECVIKQLKDINKPFAIILNSATPEAQSTVDL